MNGDVIKLSFPAKPDYILAVRLTVSAIAQRIGFHIDDIEDIKVASAEACILLLSVGSKTLDISITIKDGIQIDVKAEGELTGAETEANGEMSQYLLEALVDTCEMIEKDGALTGVSIYKKR